MLAVNPVGYHVRFIPPTSGTCPTSTLQYTISAPLSRGRPTLPWRRGHSPLCREAKGNNKVESKVEGLVGLSVFLHPAIIASDWVLQWFDYPSIMRPYQILKGIFVGLQLVVETPPESEVI